ncbi:VOC family protein [soil metagenome]
MSTPNTFNWVDLMTTDQQVAKNFYTELFGWQTRDEPIDDDNTYTMFMSGDDSIAGAGEYPDEQKQQGMPPVWNNYITVEDVDAKAKEAEQLGATVVMPPMDVMTAGRMAMLQDPGGAFVSLWEDRDHSGATKFNEPGALTWNELATADTQASGEFYTSLLGWTEETRDFGGRPYTTFSNSDRPTAGMLDMTGVVPEGVPPHWMAYFAVADANATIADVERLGGQTMNGPRDLPGVGTMAVLTDPQGAAFAILQPEQR